MPPELPPDHRRPTHVGLLAGWGEYPLLVARALKARGCRVYCLGIKGHADPHLAAVCDDFRYVGVAQLGRQIRYFVRHGVTQATMAGKLFKARMLYGGLLLLRHVPDWRCVRVMYPYFITNTRDRRDDTLMSAVVRTFAEDGIEFAPATDFAPELLVKHGILAGPALSAAQQRDIEIGWHVAKELGRLDIGQTIAIKNGTTLAVEAVEGTDACIERAGALCRNGGFTVVKVAKPQQDMRFDVPTVGPETIERLARAQARTLAMEADKTILIGEPEVARLARKHRITIVALRDSDIDTAGADAA